MTSSHMSLDAATAAVSEVEAEIRDLEAKSAEIARQASVAAVEAEEAAAAVGRAIVDGLPVKQRDTLAGAQLKAEAALRALQMAGDEVAARLDRARDRLDVARRDLVAARERDAYARTATALVEFTDRFVEALAALQAAVDRRHTSDVNDQVRTACAGPLIPARIAADLAEWVTHCRRRAGQLEAVAQAIAPPAGPPPPCDTGVIVRADLTFYTADGNSMTVEKDWIGNLPAEVVAKAVTQGIAERLGPRSGFKAVVVLQSAEAPNDDGELVAVHEGPKSLPVVVADQLIASGVAIPSDALDDRDIAFHRANFPKSAFMPANRKVAPVVNLGLIVRTVVGKEAA